MNTKSLFIRITKSYELTELILNQPIWLIPKDGKIELSIDHLPSEENSQWEYKLNKHYFDCGCNKGAIGVIVAIVIYLIYLFFSSDLEYLFQWSTLIYLLLAGIIGGSIGKIFGLLNARLQFRKTIRSLLIILN